MREHKITFFAVPGPDGSPRVIQAVNDFKPVDGIEITEGHARQIMAELRALQAKDEEVAPAGYVTEERARALAAEAANIAVRAFAAEIAKSAGGGDANQ